MSDHQLSHGRPSYALKLRSPKIKAHFPALPQTNQRATIVHHVHPRPRDDPPTCTDCGWKHISNTNDIKCPLLMTCVPNTNTAALSHIQSDARIQPEYNQPDRMRAIEATECQSVTLMAPANEPIPRGSVRALKDSKRKKRGGRGKNRKNKLLLPTDPITEPVAFPSDNKSEYRPIASPDPSLLKKL